MKPLLFAAAIAIAAAGCAKNEPAENWVPLFNGEDLDGWTPKFAKHPLGENVHDTFRVEDGLLKVVYEDWDEPLDDQFGHLYYSERPFSRYRLRAEVRFVGEQVEGGPGWAVRNNGLMIHSQPPETMALDQDFPASIEVQLLADDGSGERPTANMCSPLTSIVINGERDETHCILSDAKTYPADEWVTVELEVLGGETIRHFVNGEEVMAYSAPEYDEPHPWQPGALAEGGYITIQAESAPTQFRKIEILELED